MTGEARAILFLATCPAAFPSPADPSTYHGMPFAVVEKGTKDEKPSYFLSLFFKKETIPFSSICIGQDDAH